MPRRSLVTIAAVLATSVATLPAGGALAPASAMVGDPGEKPVASCPTVSRLPLREGPHVRGTSRSGRFLVHVTKAGLSVSTVSAPDRALWASVPDRPFVTAQRGSVRWLHPAGAVFQMQTSVTACWQAQRIDSVSRDGAAVLLRGRIGGGPGRAVPYELRIAPASADRVAMTVRLLGGQADAVTLTGASTAGEHVHGFGLMTRWNWKGAVVPVVTREQGVGRGEQPLTGIEDAAAPGGGGSFDTTYAVVPQYLTSRDRGFFLADTQFATFDLRRADRIAVTVWSGTMQAQVLSGTTPDQLIKAYTEYSGRMRPLPTWTGRGAVIGVQGGTARVRAEVARLRSAGVPVAAVWLQDWVGQRTTSFGKRLWWNWELDPEQYPGWDALVRDFRAQGIRVLTYVNPMFVDASTEPGVTRNLYAEGIEHGYFVKHADGTPYLLPQGGYSAGLLDLTNPAARAWMKQILVDMAREYGASGWMADFGEQLPFDARLDRGSAAVWHNRYPAAWAQLNAEALREAGLSAVVDWHRSAGATSPRYQRLTWMGDQTVDWSRQDGLASALTGELSGGLSGFALDHSDIGGYTTLVTPAVHRSPELLLRWAEMSAFSDAMFRTHEGNRPELDAQAYSTPAIAHQFAQSARLFAALAPYRQGLERRAAATGLPITRPLWLLAPTDPVAERLTTEFALGNDVVVAPVLRPGVVRTTAYLPAGRWVQLWSGRVVTGGRWVTVPSPLGRPAAFYRAGTPVGSELRAAR